MAHHNLIGRPSALHVVRHASGSISC